jgi:hypothetical protein
MFGKSKSEVSLSPVERTIVQNMRTYGWESALMMTVFGIPLEESTEAMATLQTKGLVIPDNGEFSSDLDPGPKYQLTRDGRKAAKS